MTIRWGSEKIRSVLWDDDSKVSATNTDWIPEYISEVITWIQEELSNTHSEPLPSPLQHLEKRDGFAGLVLEYLLTIPRGKTETYWEVARAIGKPGASRAVGTALKNNPYHIIYPCHRITRSDGTPGEYTGGTLRKIQLIRYEQANSRDDIHVSYDEAPAVSL